ncbi:MAG: hypothetical protein HQM09_07085 [Candidatus Riflebacteria bacterium]|nr:hypothetical protein [Candidatus Riflebacteria bacterium]
MDAKRLFFLGLIILSVVMGVNWFKNRPKTRKPTQRPTSLNAVYPDDQQVASKAMDAPPPIDTASRTVLTSGQEAIDKVAETASDSSNTEPDNLGSIGDTPPGFATDTIFVAWKKLNRAPFAVSPFVKMIEAAQKAKIASATPSSHTSSGTAVVLNKLIHPLPVAFSGTIETDAGLFAIIDRRIYKSGDDFGGKQIKKIEKSLVTLENSGGIWLIPKKGVKLTIASDGTYDISDEFAKKNPLGN